MRSADLVTGSIYFGVTYDGSGDEIQLSERQLDLILDVGGLIELLARFRDGKPMQTRHAS